MSRKLIYDNRYPLRREQKCNVGKNVNLNVLPIFKTTISGQVKKTYEQKIAQRPYVFSGLTRICIGKVKFKTDTKTFSLGIARICIGKVKS